ncbi:expressed unknown protein [Seminavis robusta]|uniref:Uncharacterized protein n=1 Tax=Seminavis robusta TaxID=568900 RepID=A0A9N8HDA3_9STRA|nr:expressed unknown protein [Seminavis robusta]|eukprot:Sro450_g145580.1 n/a (171) ;mRNA; f:38863-39375
MSEVLVDQTRTLSTEEAKGLQLTLSDDTDNMILENSMQKAACQSICKDMMFMGQCDDDEVGAGELLYSATERCPVVLVYREDEQEEETFSESSNKKKNTPTNRKRSLFRRRSQTSQATTTPTPTQRTPENVDVVFVEQDSEASSECAIEVCSSPSNEVDDLCNRQGWPRT